MGESTEDSASEPTSPPLSRLGRVFGFGVAVGVGVALALSVTSELQYATSTAFALGALIFGLALLGWTAAVSAGPRLESANKYLETGSNFSAARTQRAMLLLTGIGLGAMVGASVLSFLLV
jgi:hypothetical protein